MTPKIFWLVLFGSIFIARAEEVQEVQEEETAQTREGKCKLLTSPPCVSKDNFQIADDFSASNFQRGQISRNSIFLRLIDYSLSEIY